MPVDVNSTELTALEKVALEDIVKDSQELLKKLQRLDKSQPDTKFIQRCERCIELIENLNGTSLTILEAWKEAVETQ